MSPGSATNHAWQGSNFGDISPKNSKYRFFITVH